MKRESRESESKVEGERKESEKRHKREGEESGRRAKGEVKDSEKGAKRRRGDYFGPRRPPPAR